MGILEIIGELIKPGKIGGINFNKKGLKNNQKLIIIRFIISLTTILLFEYLILIKNDHYYDFRYMLKVNVFLIIYLIFSYKIKIKPNYGNLGWVPFLINNPFKFSDNINRLLVIINILMVPGKYISRNIRDFNHYLTQKI